MIHNDNDLELLFTISNIYDRICYWNDNNFRFEDGRVLMRALENRTCAVTVDPVLYKDDGIWNITIESGIGDKKRAVTYIHNVSVTNQG